MILVTLAFLLGPFNFSVSSVLAPIVFFLIELGLGLLFPSMLRCAAVGQTLVHWSIVH
jgi:hypothetical protein